MKQTIVLGICSSIAAYKSVQLVSDLIKKGYDVEVVMTKNATQFIAPLTFSTLTKHKTYVDTFDREVEYEVEHISLAKKADLFLIVPASANVIAKVAHGISDDMLTTTFLASNCTKAIAPAMNTQMYLNPITQDNLETCKGYGMHILEPSSGLLACGDEGVGKLAPLDDLMDAIEYLMQKDKSLLGKKILISAGPTMEYIDPVRFLSNASSGKMGYALAKQARNMGAEVTLVSGTTKLRVPTNLNLQLVTSASDMEKAMLSHYDACDIAIMCAAVSDYTYQQPHLHKMKKGKDTLPLEFKKTNDILKELGKRKQHQLLCGFAMESQHLIDYASEKRTAKNCDLMVANPLLEADAGFQSDTNKATLIWDAHVEPLPLLSKDALAKQILLKLVEMGE